MARRVALLGTPAPEHAECTGRGVDAPPRGRALEARERRRSASDPKRRSRRGGVSQRARGGTLSPRPGRGEMILGSGVDVIQVQRIEHAHERFGRRCERRVLHDAQVRLCRRHQRPTLQYALRFAAKEALMKAIGTRWARGVRWVDISMGGSESRALAAVRLEGRTA